MIKIMKLNKEQDYCINICKSRCCKRLCIKWSPKTLERKYNEWVKTGVYSNIHLIFPMLQFIEKDPNNKKRPYYYKCKMLINGKCSIYKHRPYMCSGFGVEYPAEGFKKCIYIKNDTKNNTSNMDRSKKTSD